VPHAICIAAQSNALLLVISLWTCHCSHIHEYWKEHNRIASGVYNWMFDLDRQVQYSLETIPRDTIDLFRKKLMMEVRPIHRIPQCSCRAWSFLKHAGTMFSLRYVQT
jgi:hypothetical protein